MTEPFGDRQYKGEVAVLLDSDSAAAEVTARVLQLEQRAKIYGEVSSGSVMTSVKVPFEAIGAFADYADMNVGMGVTIADVITRDGSRLENTGVKPDETMISTGAARRRQNRPGARLRGFEVRRGHFARKSRKLLLYDRKR